MSREARDRVWNSSKFGGSQLVLLLALAERADVAGVCWPGYERLQSLCRLEKRQIRALLSQLEAAGEIHTPTRFGRGNYPIYVVTAGLSADEIAPILSSHEALRERGLLVSSVEAKAIAEGIVGRREKNPEKGQDSAPFRRGKKGQNTTLFDDKKGAEFCTEKGQDSAQAKSEKGAGSCTAYKDEPSGEPSDEPSESENTRDTPPQRSAHSPPQNSRGMFDLNGGDDPRFHTPHYSALLDACELTDNRLKAIPVRRAKVAGIAVILSEEFTPEQIAQARSNWRLPTSPTPEQMLEKIQSLLNRKEIVETNAISNSTGNNLPTRVANDDDAVRRFIAGRSKS